MTDASPDTTIDSGGETPAPPSILRKILIVVGTVLVVALVLGVAVRVLVMTPPGRAIVERTLDGMSLGSLGVLHVEGLQGDPLGRLEVARLSIVDGEGPWIEAEDVTLHWRPGSLVHHIAYVEELSAERLHLLRRPDVGGGSGGGGGRSWGFALDTLSLPRIELDQPVVGAAAVLAAEASVDSDPDRSLTVDLDLRRTDIAGDVLMLSGDIAPTGHGELQAELIAPADGPLASLIRLPSQTIVANATLSGDLREGEGELDATLGDAPFLDASGSWGPAGAAAQVSVELSAAPELADFARRFGPALTAALTLGPVDGDRRSMTLEASVDALTLHAAGPVNLRTRRAPDGLDVTASTPDLDRLIGDYVTDRASFGAVEATGRFTHGDTLAFVGDISGSDLAFDGWSAGSAVGAASIFWSSDTARVEADLAVTNAGAPEAFAGMVGETPQVAAVVAYDYAERRLSVTGAHVVAAAGEATGEASWTLGGGPLSASAQATITDAAPLPQLASGSGTLTLALNRAAEGEPIRVEIAGSGESLVAESASLTDLLGSTATVDAAFAIADGGATIERASLRGQQLVVEARGSAARSTGYALDIDVGIDGPVAAGPVDIDGRATAAARLEGDYASPSLRLDIRADTLAAGPVTLTAPRLRAELADVFDAPTGTVAFDAMTESGPATLSTEISYSDGALQARAIEGGWRDFSISGEASRSQTAPPSGTLTLGGLGGRLAADVSLELETGPPRLDLHATLRDQPIADAGVLAALNVAVVGPLDALELAASARGYAGSEFSLEASGTLTQGDGETRLTLNPRGMLGEDEVSAPEPWTATFRGGDAAIDASLDAAGGTLSVQLDRTGGLTTLNAELADAPLALVNLVRPDPALEGRASGTIALQGRETLEGSMRFVIAEARAPDYAPDEHLELTLELTHDVQGADVAFAATDGEDFHADVSGRAPFVIDAWPPVPSVDRDAAVSLTGEAMGDVAALWSLIGIPGFAVAGEVDVDGSLSGTMRAPTFGGSASVSNGRLEEARIGLLLTDLTGAVRLEGPRLVIERASATDGAGGRVTAEGEIEFGGEPGSRTRVAVDLTGLQVISTTDNSAQASGDLVFERDADGSQLSGALTVDRADLTPPRGGAGAVTVPTLNVIEINRPADLAPPPRARSSAMRLDLEATAERRVFLRSSSIDTEWAFDVDVGGTTAAPTVEGTATLVRGTLMLAGEYFELTRSRIMFDGDPREAQIDLTATRDNADVSVTAHVTGTAQQPQVELSSSPSYPQDEILARMLFGRAQSDLSPFEAAQLAGAVASLAGGESFDLLGPLRQTLGVDRLGVSSSGGGALVSGGRYLGEDVYLEVSGGGTGLAEASIEWEIRPRLELATRFGIARDTRVSIRWRKDY